MNRKLELFQNVVNGELDWDTELSIHEAQEVKPDVYGFAYGSEAYKVANELNIEITQVHSDNPQGDLFYTPVQRYLIDYEKFYDKFPFHFGGEKMELEIHEDGSYNPVAYDESDVMFECPRGICYIPRHAWTDGFRSCAGC